MGQLLLNCDTQLNESLLTEVLEEHHSVPNMPIHFLERIALKGLRLRLNEILFFSQVEVSLY
jgi:hypothetical protein